MTFLYSSPVVELPAQLQNHLYHYVRNLNRFYSRQFLPFWNYTITLNNYTNIIMKDQVCYVLEIKLDTIGMFLVFKIIEFTAVKSTCQWIIDCSCIKKIYILIIFHKYKRQWSIFFCLYHQEFYQFHIFLLHII